MSRYGQSLGRKCSLTKSCVCGKYWPIVGGNAIRRPRRR